MGDCARTIFQTDVQHTLVKGCIRGQPDNMMRALALRSVDLMKGRVMLRDLSPVMTLFNQDEGMESKPTQSMGAAYRTHDSFASSLVQQRDASSWAFWRSKPSAEPTQPHHAMESSDTFPSTALPPSSASQPSADLGDAEAPFPMSEALDCAESIQQACAALEAGSIAAAKAEVFFTTGLFMECFQKVHETGLPWWAALTAVNVTTRLLMSPAIILQQRATAKMIAFNLSMMHAKKLQEALSKAKTPEEQQQLSHALREEYDVQLAKHGHPLKIVYIIPLVLIANATIFISIFSATSQLMASKAPSLLTGGMLWFHDLTISDAYYGLPVICCLVTLAMVEYGIAMNGESPTMQKQAETFKWLMRGLSFAFIPTGAYVPAGVAVLWVSNSAFGVAQGFVLRNDGFRRRVGLPTLKEMKDMGETLAEASKPNHSATMAPSFPVATTLARGHALPLQPVKQPPPPGTPPHMS